MAASRVRAAPPHRIAADVVRIEDGRLAEHWDVLQDEATEAELKSGQTDVRRPVPRLNMIGEMLMPQSQATVLLPSPPGQ